MATTARGGHTENPMNTKPPKRQSSFPSTLCLAFALVSGASFAPPATAFPIYNAEAACPVMTNLKGTDNLTLDRVLISRDCKTIYVKPPNHGKLVLDSIVGSGSLFRCDEWTSELRTLKNFSDAKMVLSDHHSAAIAAKNFKEAGEITQHVMELDNSIGSLRTNLRRYFEKVDGAHGTGLLTIPWGRDIDDFVEKNDLESKGIQISTLPIVGGYLSFVSKQYSPIPSTGEFVYQQEFPIVFSVKVAGLHSIYEVLAASDATSRLSPLIGRPQNQRDVVAFESGAAAAIHMSLAGACSFYDTESKRFRPTVFSEPKTSPLALVTAVYTYVFPVASEASITVKLDVNQTADIVLSRISTATGDISAEAVVEDMMELQGPGTTLKVTVKQGLRTNFSEKQKEALKQEALTTLAHGILGRLGKLISSTDLDELKFATKPIIEEKRLKRHCDRVGFLGLSRRCSTHTYKVDIDQSVREGRVRKAVADVQFHLESEQTELNYFMNFGTVPFRVAYQPKP